MADADLIDLANAAALATVESLSRLRCAPVSLAIAVATVPRPLPQEKAAADMPLREARALFEAEFLAAVVSRHNGNITAAAKAAGMERAAFHRKIAGLGIGVTRPSPQKKVPTDA